MKDRARTLDHRLHSAFDWVLKRLPTRLGDWVRKRTGGRLGIGTQIVLGLGGGVLLTVGAIVMALVLMSIVSARQGEVTEVHIPALAGAFNISERSAELVRATPRLVTAADLPQLDTVRMDVTVTESLLQEAVDVVVGAEAGGDVGARVVPLVDSLTEMVREIDQSMRRRMAHQTRLEELKQQLRDFNLRLQNETLEAELDDQHFFMYTGLRELTDAPVPLSQRRTTAELDHYVGLLNFKAYQNEAAQYIERAAAENDIVQLGAHLERVETALENVSGSLEKIRYRLSSRLQSQVQELTELYGAPDGVFAQRTGELEEIANADSLVGHSGRIATELVNRVETLVGLAERSAESAAERSNALVQLGFWSLLVITILTIAMAYVAWKFFGERLLVRMGRLSSATRQMSKGDLDVQVEIEGDDELTDMAGALEVFRQHAVEVQRLNLVEKLAAEVQAKNDKLEDTLENLRRTQQQVVSQEKLASLGALTAGIAHEIRNPLNFINNFAALSTELIDELKEELEEATNGDGELDREYVEEILGDLNTNVVKVNEHGQRANRIVEGMLAHSREEAGQVESIDINLMVQEYAKLAYHGIRGTDSTFNVDMIHQYDKDAGNVDGIARDLSRVFLNIITNACHATQARGRNESDGYLPTVTVSTEGRENNVRVTVHDNGTGMPDKVLRKIFDPFFTTKSGTQGTGLGLSISHEIIQEHGGRIEVETEEGKGTEFRITLPRKGYEPVTAAS